METCMTREVVDISTEKSGGTQHSPTSNLHAPGKVITKVPDACGKVITDALTAQSSSGIHGNIDYFTRPKQPCGFTEHTMLAESADAASNFEEIVASDEQPAHDAHSDTIVIHKTDVREKDEGMTCDKVTMEETTEMKQNESYGDLEISETEKIVVVDQQEVGSNVTKAEKVTIKVEPSGEEETRNAEETTDTQLVTAFEISIPVKHEITTNVTKPEKVTIKVEPLSDADTMMLDYRAAEIKRSCSEEDSSSSSDSDSHNSREHGEDEKRKCSIDKADQDVAEDSGHALKTKGELGLEDLPPIDTLQITISESVRMKKVGKVSSIVGTLVVVQANCNLPALNMETILFLDNRVPMGRVFEVFGPVTAPFYSLRFNALSDIEDRNISPGDAVYYAPDEPDFTNYVFLEQLRRMKGSDASWEFNNEPPERYLEYSDDEQEKNAKKRLEREKKGEKIEDEEDGEQKKFRKKPRKRSQFENQKNETAEHGTSSWNQNRQGFPRPARANGGHFALRGSHHDMSRGGMFPHPPAPFSPFGRGFRTPWSGPPMHGENHPPYPPHMGRPPFNQNGCYGATSPFSNSMQPPPQFGFSPYQRPGLPPPVNMPPSSPIRPEAPTRHGPPHPSGHMNTQRHVQSFNNHNFSGSNTLQFEQVFWQESYQQTNQSSEPVQIMDRRFIKQAP